MLNETKRKNTFLSYFFLTVASLFIRVIPLGLLLVPLFFSFHQLHFLEE